MPGVPEGFERGIKNASLHGKIKLVARPQITLVVLIGIIFDFDEINFVIYLWITGIPIESRYTNAYSYNSYNSYKTFIIITAAMQGGPRND
jgi:hypothetical protein